jgi:hypothetical protein
MNCSNIFNVIFKESSAKMIPFFVMGLLHKAKLSSVLTLYLKELWLAAKFI